MTHRCLPTCVTCWVPSTLTRFVELVEQWCTRPEQSGSSITCTEESSTVASRVNIKRETKMIQSAMNPNDEFPINRWVVRAIDDGELLGHSSTWWAAWRIACASVGWKAPK